MKRTSLTRWSYCVGWVVAILIGSGASAYAIVNGATDLGSVGVTSEAQFPSNLADDGVLGPDGHSLDTDEFEEAFEAGDAFFETNFNALDGVGANVGNGQRFSRFPRADLNGARQWNQHLPARATGPNADACNGCHEQTASADDVALFNNGAARFKNGDGAFIMGLEADDGSGRSENDAVRDPTHSGRLNRFIERNAPHLFGLGAVQRLAEEMTVDLMADRTAAIVDACNASVGSRRTRSLCSENRSRRLDDTLESVCFGSISATRVSSGGKICPNNGSRRYTVDTSSVTGISADLVVRPFQWKGSVAFIRDFARDAGHNELGMQGVEITGDNVDGDGDGVVNELTINDLTNMAVYQAGQPRPVTVIDLAAAGLVDPPLSQAEQAQIARGAAIFANIGCANCHKFSMLLSNPTFSEPSQSAFYRDNGQFPAGQPVPLPGKIQFDLTLDLPDNKIFDAASGAEVADLGNFQKQTDASLPGFGKTLVNLLGDLRRHNLGSNLAEAIQDQDGTGGSSISAGTFLTENLWGLASTAPYLHDGRATTPSEAVLEHTCRLNADLPGRPGVRCTDRGEAASAVDAFRTLSPSQRIDLEAAGRALLLFKAG